MEQTSIQINRQREGYKNGSKINSMIYPNGSADLLESIIIKGIFEHEHTITDK